MTGADDRARTANGPAVRRLAMGKSVVCVDGALGDLDAVVIDPERKRVTHLGVLLHRQPGRGRLVPIELARETGDQAGISLRCTVEEAHRLPPLHELAYLHLGQVPSSDPDWDVGFQEAVAVPQGGAGAFIEYHPNPDPEVVIMYDRVPKGAAELRRSSVVTTTDGHDVGGVDGFIVDDGQITDLVLRRGHAWRRGEVLIPADALAEVRTDKVVLRLTSSELKRLASERRDESARRR